MKNHGIDKSLFPWVAIVLMLFLVTLIISGAVLYYKRQEIHFLAKVRDEISAIANLKMQQVKSWRDERFADAAILSTCGLVTRESASIHDFSNAQSPLWSLLSGFKANYGYSAIIVFDTTGKAIQNSGNSNHAPFFVDTNAVRRVITGKKTESIDFYRCPVCNKVHFDILAPLCSDSTVIGVALLRRMPEEFLFPLIQAWPTSKLTSEALLFRIEKDSIVYLNELRHRKDSSLKLRLSVHSPDLPAARVARGSRDFMEGIDYRGEKVFAVGMPIPGTPWFIIAKADKKEVMLPFRNSGRKIIIITALSIVVVVFLLAFSWMAYDRKMLIVRYHEELKYREATETIRIKDELIKMTGEMAKVGGWEFDAVTRKGTWTDEVARIHDLDPALETDVEKGLSFYSGQNRHIIELAVKDAIERGVPYDHELEMTSAKGTVKWVRTIGIPVKGNGKIVKVRGIFQDITSQKQAQNERETMIRLFQLLNSKNDLHDLIKAVVSFMQELSDCEAVGIRLREGEDFPYFETSGFQSEFIKLENTLCAVDENGILLRDATGNPVIECMCGNILCGRFDQTKPFFTSGGSFWSNCTTDLLATTTDADRQARTRNRCNGAGYESVALIPLRTGETTFGLLQLNDHRKDRFSPGMIALYERLAVSIAIALAQRNAEREAVRLNVQLKEKNRELEQIVYIASHDLRSPLVNIQGFTKELDISLEELAEVLAVHSFTGNERERIDAILGNEIPEAREYILASVSKMESLLVGLLKLSRLGRAAVTIEQLDMNGLLKQVITTFEYRIKESNTDLVVEPLPACRGDRMQVNQVFSNLIDNALKFLKPGQRGAIKITGKKEKEHSVYCIEDNGIGIAEEHLEKIFELFYRLDPAKVPGEGLGLYIVSRIIGRLNGKAWVKSEKGEGSGFYVSLPV